MSTVVFNRIYHKGIYTNLPLFLENCLELYSELISLLL